MKTRAAVLRDVGKDWEVIEMDLDPPKEGEVLIRFAAANLLAAVPALLAARSQPARLLRAE